VVLLLSKEVKLVQTIDRLKTFAKDENADKQIEAELDAMSAPKLWQLRDGKIAEVHTPYTTRAKELAELSRGLRSKGLSVDERLDVLMNVKWTVRQKPVPQCFFVALCTRPSLSVFCNIVHR
jgi:hypothetical protein